MDLPVLSALRDDGSLDPAADPGLADPELLHLYRSMVLLRALDEKGVVLQRSGRIGFYITSAGQEACPVGAGYAAGDGDWIFPSYRDHGAALARGYPLRALVGQLFGNAADATRGRQMPNHWCDRSINVVSVSSPVATQVPQAVGAAHAAALRGEPVAVIVFFGDGGTSTGEFHAGMNFAGVFGAPVVFFCENNRYAISVPVSRQTAAPSLACKAEGYGFSGVRVDGNDVLAVHRVTRDAMAKARAGDGPTLIEAMTYRMGPHSSSDDPTRYRPEAELEPWRKRDPIRRFGAFLRARGVLAEEAEGALREEAAAVVRETVREVEGAAPVPIESMFEDVYERMPWHLAEQVASVKAAV